MLDNIGAAMGRLPNDEEQQRMFELVDALPTVVQYSTAECARFSRTSYSRAYRVVGGNGMTGTGSLESKHL